MATPLLQAQVVYTEPIFPQLDDDVTIYFDASKGNGALKDFTGTIYAHTGVITDESTSPTDWKNVVAEWGTADARIRMTRASTNLYTLEFNIKDFYGLADGTDVREMAFVFRDADGSVVGRDTDGSDLFVPVYSSGSELLTTFITPTETSLVLPKGSRLAINAAASVEATLRLTDNSDELTQTTGTTLLYTLEVTGEGNHVVEFTAETGQSTSTQSFQYVVPNTTGTEDPPMGTELGINYISNTEVILALYAPGKRHVFLLSDVNDWALDTDYQLKKSTDGNTFWIRLENLQPDRTYTYQYLVDGDIKIADPYSTLVLDPFHDGFIGPETYPDLPPYPSDKASGIVSVLQTDASPYDWQVNNFEAPEVSDLVIYELLLRDFLAAHDYKSLIDTLSYLEKLGVNAIELMPISEFEGNNSWGYNPSFHLALDKYYGPINDFKRFVDEAHARGMAVIVDVVYNHAFSQSPLAQLYWDPLLFKPRPDNPWLNPDARHPFNVGYDFNHESPATKTYVERAIRYWLSEFRLDGFRFDLSKGFTQVDYGNDVGAWGQYDASRIAILKNYADVMWSVNPDAYAMMEHFAENREEKELAEYGMLFWNNMSFQYAEGAMSFNSNFNGSDYKDRDWSVPHLITYMESHDEERMLYKLRNFGKMVPGYNTRDFETSLDRAELASAFFYTIPGPKMLWQFGELGYGFSINLCPDEVTISDACRVDPKPIRWDYLATPGRQRLLDVTRSLIYLKTNYEVFNTTDYDLSVADPMKKRIQLNSDNMNVNVLGNFNVENESIDPAFQKTGWWYEFFTGDSLQVSDVNALINLEPGEYRLYTTIRIELPEDFLTSSKDLEAARIGFALYPNPVERELWAAYELAESSRVRAVVYNMLGQEVATLLDEQRPAGPQRHEWQVDLPEGAYFLRLSVGDRALSQKFIVSGQ